MSRRTRRRVIAGLLSTLLFLLLVEGILVALDPLGVRVYDDWLPLFQAVVAHPIRQYVLKPGRYSLSYGPVTVAPDHTRVVPDSQGGPCVIVFVGDSMVFGLGVKDSDTWINRLARNLPGTTLVNAGMFGYNSEQIRWTLALFPDAAVLVYLVYGNDDEVTRSLVGGAGWLVRLGAESMTLRYADFLGQDDHGSPRDRPRFEVDLTSIRRDSRVILVAFDDVWGRQFGEQFDAYLIPLYTRRLSYFDGHPDAAGNREIAAAIAPIVERAVRERCTAII